MSTARPLSAHDARIAKKTRAVRAATGTATDEALQQAYEIGREGGPRMRFEPGDDPRLREMYRLGRNEHAAEARKTRARDITAKTGGYLGRARDTVAAGASEGTGSIVGVAVAVLGVIALFLLLNKTSLATGVINGVLGAATWLIAPKPLPF